MAMPISTPCLTGAPNLSATTAATAHGRLLQGEEVRVQRRLATRELDDVGSPSLSTIASSMAAS